MIQELVYTSSQKGLKLGSSGFCTVGSSPGMAQNMALFLESLSGYRHLFEPKNPANPVVYSHLRQKLGGVEYSILSRIADAGLDYSNRSNKIAHHVAVSKSERGNSSPGVLLANDFMIGQWTSSARQLPPRGTPNIAPLPMRACKLWGATFGDAGWGGALVDAWKSKRITYVLIEPNTNAIGLVQEALSLLPVHEQWDVSFSTFFTRLPPKVECDWRFVIAGSQEATAARRTRGALIVDTTHQSPAPNSRYAEAARTGKLPAGARPNSGSGTKADGIPSQMQTGIDLLDDDLPLVEQEYKVEPVPIRGRGKAKAVPPGMGRNSDEAFQSNQSGVDATEVPTIPPSKHRSIAVLIAAVVSVLFIASLITIVYLLIRSDDEKNELLLIAENAIEKLDAAKSSQVDAESQVNALESELNKIKGDLKLLKAKKANSVFRKKILQKQGGRQKPKNNDGGVEGKKPGTGDSNGKRKPEIQAPETTPEPTSLIRKLFQKPAGNDYQICEFSENVEFKQLELINPAGDEIPIFEINATEKKIVRTSPSEIDLFKVRINNGKTLVLGSTTGIPVDETTIREDPWFFSCFVKIKSTRNTQRAEYVQLVSKPIQIYDEGKVLRTIEIDKDKAKVPAKLSTLFGDSFFHFVLQDTKDENGDHLVMNESKLKVSEFLKKIRSTISKKLIDARAKQKDLTVKSTKLGRWIKLSKQKKDSGSLMGKDKNEYDKLEEEFKRVQDPVGAQREVDSDSGILRNWLRSFPPSECTVDCYPIFEDPGIPELKSRVPAFQFKIKYVEK